jgi:hypothetical protein
MTDLLRSMDGSRTALSSTSSLAMPSMWVISLSQPRGAG